jgi:hypothetical protein
MISGFLIVDSLMIGQLSSCSNAEALPNRRNNGHKCECQESGEQEHGLRSPPNLAFSINDQQSPIKNQSTINDR